MHACAHPAQVSSISAQLHQRFFLYVWKHAHTPDYRAIISSGVNLIVQPSLSICPAMLHHDVVSQIHKRQNNVKKNIFIRIIYQNSKLYNCTIVQIAQMCTCGSLIYRYYVPVTLSFKMFLSFIWIAFCKERNNKMEALVLYCYYYDYYSWFSPPVLPLMERQLHILLSIFWGLCFLSSEQPLKCAEVQRCLQSLKTRDTTL